MYSHDSEAALYQHLSMHRYVDDIVELRNSNILLSTTNERLTKQIRFLESELQKSRSQLDELLRDFRIYQSESEEARKSVADQLQWFRQSQSQYEKRHQELKKENAQLRGFLRQSIPERDHDIHATDPIQCDININRSSDCSVDDTSGNSDVEKVVNSQVLLSPRIILGGLFS